MMRRAPFVLGYYLLVSTLAGAVAAWPTAPRQRADADENSEYYTAIQLADPRAEVAALRRFIEAHPANSLVPYARLFLVHALVAVRAPTDDVLTAAAPAFDTIPDPMHRWELYNTLARELGDRDERLDLALDYAAKALAAVPDEDRTGARSSAEATIGWVRLRRREYPEAIAALMAVGPDSTDLQEALYRLGVAYEAASQPDQAIDAYVRSAATFLGKSRDADTALHALYRKRFGSLKGLEGRLSAARAASRNQIALDSRRYEKAAPDWQLPALAGGTVKMSDLRGKVVVVDFWGSWCPPCRKELPALQALYNAYRRQGVAVVAMNWEPPAEPAARMKAVRDFVDANGYTFPVALDHDGVAANAFGLNFMFPSVYVIDRSGRIRYLNVGYEDGVGQILAAQIESLLGGRPAR